ncbi:hypothetical protein RF638_15510 [Kocuria sp. CPCC 205235]|uniref:hypothetical protein n=1 Tax=Kocuria sp. CPCC 205235 TaxID=3073549 RepID=UPI0034D6D5EA
MTTDVVLNTLIPLAERGATMNITLLTDGQIVQGDVIPASEYFEKVAQIFEGLGHESGRELSQVYLDTGKRVKAQEVEDRVIADQAASEAREAEDDHDSQPKRHFIHLKNAAIVQSSQGGVTALEPKLLRIKLDSISGWSFGSFTLDN